MEKIRKLHKVVEGAPKIDGAGVRLLRVIGRDNVEDFDPFLMLDAFDSKNPEDYEKGFPWHPHRGIETVTYLMEGNVEHSDSLGNAGVIRDGDCQWMTAGSGIIHQEMPRKRPRMLGTQLWVNLPAKDKMIEPRYRDITASQIPVLEDGDATIRLLAGHYGDVTGPVEDITIRPTYMDVSIKGEGTFSVETNPADTLFIYIIHGTGILKAEEHAPLPAKKAVLFREGEQFSITAGSDGIRFLLFSGKPLQEPVAWGGPIVMNTKEELQQAFKELDEGTFIKTGSRQR